MGKLTFDHLISRECHDPEYVAHILEELVQSYTNGDPDWTCEMVMSATHQANKELFLEFSQDAETAHSVFQEMLRNEARGKPH